MSRTRKQPYTKSKRFDPSCRNHGSCTWCVGNRTHSSVKRQLDDIAVEQAIAADPDSYPTEDGRGNVNPGHFE